MKKTICTILLSLFVCASSFALDFTGDITLTRRSVSSVQFGIGQGVALIASADAPDWLRNRANVKLEGTQSNPIDHVKIQEAIDELLFVVGLHQGGNRLGTIVFTPGQYHMGHEVTVHGGIQLIGMSQIGTVFFVQTESNKSVFVDYYIQGVTAVSTGSKTFSIDGDYTSYAGLGNGETIYIVDSTSNDDDYTIVSTTYTGGKTVITVSETISSATADGRLRWSNGDSYPSFQLYRNLAFWGKGDSNWYTAQQNDDAQLSASNTSNSAIYISNGSSQHIRVENCRAKEFGGTSFEIPSAQGNTFYGTFSDVCNAWGIYGGQHVIACSVSQAGAGIRVGTDGMIIGNRVDKTMGMSIVSDASSCVINGNTCGRAWQATSTDDVNDFPGTNRIGSNTYASSAYSGNDRGAIYVVGGGRNAVITGNAIHDSDSNMQFGVYINAYGNASPPGQFVIYGNSIENASSYAVHVNDALVTDGGVITNYRPIIHDNDVLAVTVVDIGTPLTYSNLGQDNTTTRNNSLPAAQPGMKYRFVRAQYDTDQDIQVDPDGTETITLLNGTTLTGGYWRGNSTSSNDYYEIVVECFEVGKWQVTSEIGTGVSQAS